MKVGSKKRGPVTRPNQTLAQFILEQESSTRARQSHRDSGTTPLHAHRPIEGSWVESATAPGSEARPQLPLVVSRLGPKTPASIAGGFVCGTHPSRAAKGALTKDPLWAKKRRRSPPIRRRALRQKLLKLQGPTPGAQRRLRDIVKTVQRPALAKLIGFRGGAVLPR
jgi:hypothetical protein